MSFLEGIGWGVAIGLVLLIGAVMVGVYLVMARRRGYGQRDGDLEELARELRLNFRAKWHVPEGALKAVPTAIGGDAGRVPLPLFRRRPGHDELANVLLTLEEESPRVWIGDWELVPDPRDIGQEIVVTVTIVQSQYLALPPFALRPANLQDTNVNEDVAARRFGIRFPNDEAEGIYQEFRDNYLLLPDPEVAFGDEDAIRALFDDSLRGFFSERWALSVEGAGDWLLIYRERTQVQWQDVSSVYRETFEIYERFAASSRRLAESQAKRRDAGKRKDPPPPFDDSDPA